MHARLSQGDRLLRRGKPICNGAGVKIASVRAASIVLLLVLVALPFANIITTKSDCCCTKSGSCPMKKHGVCEDRGCSLQSSKPADVASERLTLDSTVAEEVFHLANPATTVCAEHQFVAERHLFSVLPDVPPPRAVA